MSLLGKLARRSASAALRGTGRVLAVHVIPDHITPWQIRQKTTRTSSSFLRSALRELSRKPKKKKTPTPSRKKSASYSQTTSPKRPSLLALMTFGPHRASSATAARLATSPILAPRKPGPRPSTTKGVANLSRRTSAPVAGNTTRYGAVRSAIANEARFDANGGKQGRSLRSTDDWDVVAGPAPRGRTAARSVRARPSKTAIERRGLRFQHAKSKTR